MDWGKLFRAPLSVFKKKAIAVTLAFGAMVLFANNSEAQDFEALPVPVGEVILVVTGKIAVTNVEDRAEFDRQMLENLGLSQVRTTTDWTDGTQVFEGVLARKVMERIGAEGTVAVATALNDFVSRVPLDELRRYDVLLAMRQNGTEMQVSDKGPIWIVYPRSDNPELQDPKFNDRWVWQLRELRVE